MTRFYFKTCQGCRQRFKTIYKYQKHCSIECMSDYTDKKDLVNELTQSGSYETIQKFGKVTNYQLPNTLEEGKKDDNSKTDMTNLKFDVIEQYCKALNYGEEKYGRDNYKLLDNYERRFLAANIRHLLKRIQGEIYDKESGLPHLAHCMANSGFVIEKDLKCL